MNTEAIKIEIEKLLEAHYAKIGYAYRRKQYPVAKWQLAKLTALGLIELMPYKFGYGDADVVINAAQNAGGEVETGLTAEMDDYSIRESASALYVLLHEVAEVAVPEVAVAEVATAEVEEDLGGVLDDIAHFEAARGYVDDETDFERATRDYIEACTDDLAIRAAIRAAIHRGEAAFKSGYRYRRTTSAPVGVTVGTPLHALTWRVASAGYIATVERWCYEYLVRVPVRQKVV